jgi:hypothetical protein
MRILNITEQKFGTSVDEDGAHRKKTQSMRKAEHSTLNCHL